MSNLTGSYDEMQIAREESRDLASGRYKASLVYGWDYGNSVPVPLAASSSGSIDASPGFIPSVYDYISYTNTSTTVDTYKYYSGGSSGTLVATVTITYTDTTKSQVSTVART